MFKIDTVYTDAKRLASKEYPDLKGYYVRFEYIIRRPEKSCSCGSEKCYQLQIIAPWMIGHGDPIVDRFNGSLTHVRGLLKQTIRS